MILIFISGLSSKVKIKVKSDVSPRCLQLRRARGRKTERGGKKKSAEVDSATFTLISGPHRIQEESKTTQLNDDT